jgi:hypothetical protein
MHFNFDSQLLEVFEELDKLQEDSANTEASKQFWAAAKRSEIDENAFHTAFDDELAELGLTDLFDKYGRLKNRGTYEQIKAAKEANPSSWAVKALNKLWVLSYVNFKSYLVDKELKAQRDAELAAQRKAEQEAAELKKEEERQNFIREWSPALPAALERLDQKLLNQFLEITKTDIKDLSIEHEKHTDGKAYLKLILPNYRAKFVYGIKLDATDKVAELASVLTHAIQNEFKAARAAANDVIDVFDKFTTSNSHNRYATAILLGDSGTTYKVTAKDTTGTSLFDIKEPYKVIFVRASQSDGNMRTYKNSYSWVYYSWDSSEEDKLRDYLPTLGEHNGVWSESKTTLVKSPSGDCYSKMDDIDTWAESAHTAYSTD